MNTSDNTDYAENNLFIYMLYTFFMLFGVSTYYIYQIYLKKKVKINLPENKIERIKNMVKMLNDYNNIIKRYEEKTVTQEDARRMKEIVNTFRELKLKLKKKL